MNATELRIPAIEVRQSAGRVLYSFAIDGKVVPSFAAISRVHRRDAHLEGYQRPEVLAHIGEIRDYLESESPMIPNAVVIAFDKRVHFEPAGDTGGMSYARPGTLVIPIDADSDDAAKPGFVVDGQQRLAAIRDAAIGEFPICVSAFIAHGVRDQIEQFILVNSTKPLPKGLIYELLPSTETTLPSLLRRRRFPAYLLDRLNRDEDSPLLGLIQTPTTVSSHVNPLTVSHASSRGADARFSDCSGLGDEVHAGIGDGGSEGEGRPSSAGPASVGARVRRLRGARPGRDRPWRVSPA